MFYLCFFLWCFQLFATSFPLAPLLALLTNMFDLRVDAKRLLWWYRRPIALVAQDIGKSHCRMIVWGKGRWVGGCGGKLVSAALCGMITYLRSKLYDCGLYSVLPGYLNCILWSQQCWNTEPAICVKKKKILPNVNEIHTFVRHAKKIIYHL